MDIVRIEPVVTQFRVAPEKRRISGLILPWNEVATDSSGMARWRFMRGSVQFGEPSRVKLLRDHDLSKPVGKAVSFTEHEDGLYGDFFIGRGAEGDRILEMAEDGILDGFSVGPIVPSDGWEADATDRGVRRVFESRLIEVTITAIPSFDDARVERVAATFPMTGKENSMSGDEKNKDAGGGEQTIVQNGDEAMVQFQQTLDQRLETFTERLTESLATQQTALQEAITGTFETVYTNIASAKSIEDGEKAAARIKVTKEPPIYRFDGGSRENPSMVRDYWRANTERDHDAVERLRRFQLQQRDMTTMLAAMPPSTRFAITTGSASDVIPPGYRPDLFVNELMQNRPIVAQTSRGTITDATPFTVPQFVSSTNATDDHAEGVNPTPGDLTLDSVTVSPGAVSGAFELTREIVDSANPAIDAIALAAMRESYNQQTEAKTYAAINQTASVFTNVLLADLGNGSDNTITPARDLLARYPFTRFASPTGAVMSQLVTRDFANAKGTDGRPLLPSVGAQNTAGLGNAVQQGWFIDGLPFVPAWAMTEDIGDDVAVILNRADLWVWESPLLTFRFEEKSGPAIIELALFSYFAVHVLRPAGLFALRAAAA